MVLNRMTALAVTAWLVGQTIVGNDRTCRYRDYRGRYHTTVQSASEMCAPSVQVPTC